MFEIEAGGALVLLSLLLITAGSIFIHTKQTDVALPSQPLSNQSGFSLVELMVVLTILGVLIGVSSGTWSSVRDTDQVKSAAEKIRSSMTGARMKAMSSGQIQYVGVDLYSELVTDTIDAASVYTRGANVTAAGSWNAGAIWEEMPGINLVDSKADGSAATTPMTGIKTFNFNPQGSAADYPDLTNLSLLVKSNTGVNTIGKIIRVNAVTGRVRIEDCTASCQ